MSENSYFENNHVNLIGTICDEPVFSHEIYGEKYYTVKLSVARLSDNSDIIPLTISERFFGEYYPNIGDIVSITGQYRSYNNYSGSGNKLILTVFVKEVYCYNNDIDAADDEYDYQDEYTNTNVNPNQIYLNGYICKKPSYRTTPFCREISDILLAVNRSYNKSDYIPCIAWGRNAKYAQNLEVGTNLKIWGRIQSRNYQKHVSDTETISRIAYEVSISKMEKVDE